MPAADKQIAYLTSLVDRIIEAQMTGTSAERAKAQGGYAELRNVLGCLKRDTLAQAIDTASASRLIDAAKAGLKPWIRAVVGDAAWAEYVAAHGADNDHNLPYACIGDTIRSRVRIGDEIVTVDATLTDWDHVEIDGRPHRIFDTPVRVIAKEEI